MGDSSKFWEVMASVIPVIALAFVVEVRYLRLDQMGPFRRLAVALTHAATILVLLFSEIAALNSLAGEPQADWARAVALNGCAAALAVVLSAPASKFLVIAFYGTHQSSYVGYWRVKRLLAASRRERKRLHRFLRINAAQKKRVERMIAPLAEKAAKLPSYDLPTVWAKEVNAAQLEQALSLQRDVVEHREEMARELIAVQKTERKMEQKIIKLAGRRTRRMLRQYEKNGM